MPQRDPHLDKTTQTDLLYGLAREQASDVAVLEQGADATSSDEFATSDRIVQQAATRDDLTSLVRRDGPESAAQKIGRRWRYLDGWTPPERKAVANPSLPQVVEPHVPWTMQRALHQALRHSSSWLISFLLHLIVLPPLAILSIPNMPPPTPLVTYRGAIARPPEMFDSADTPLEISTPAHLDMHVSHPVSVEFAIPEPRIDSGAMPGATTEVTTVVTAWASAGPVSDILGLMADHGRGKAQAGKGETGAEFFGSKAGGRKFVFVVDCSLSMLDDGRWPAAATELCAAIERLNSDQLFYVILFDGTVHRMFNHNERESALFPATPENKQRFREWLMTARLGPDTFPFLAMRNALALQPDAIYLLSDGEFKDSTAVFLKKFNRPFDHFGNPQHRVSIHTLAFHHRTGEAVLRRIAAENAGKYVFIPKR